MEEIFKEYGGAILAMIGTGLVMALFVNRLFGAEGAVGTILRIWGIGGV